MGLFDAFGVGGGKLHIQLQFPTAQAGSVVQGQVVYQGGRRNQNITNITVRLSCTMQVPGPQGLQGRSQDVVPNQLVTAQFTAQAGQSHQFPFQLQLPPQAYSSAPNLVSYRLTASADIDGEVDPGAGIDLQVVGVPYDPAMMGGGMHPGMHGAMAYGGMHPDKARMGRPGYDAGYDPGYAKGGYDPGMAKGGYDPAYDKGGYDPGMAKADPYGKGGYDPGMAKGGYDPGYDPGMAKGGYDPGYGKAAYGGGGYDHTSPGSHCLAQWSDGGYYGATVMQNNGSMLLVQWDDGSPAGWVRYDQTQPG